MTSHKQNNDHPHSPNFTEKKNWNVADNKPNFVYILAHFCKNILHHRQSLDALAQENKAKIMGKDGGRVREDKEHKLRNKYLRKRGGGVSEDQERKLRQ